MSSSLTDQLFEQLQGAPLQQIAQQLGAGQAQTAGAVSAALPLLLGALGRNASQPQGAQALFGALHPDDPNHELLHVLRTDWALLDAEVDGPGDTWGWRVARGRVARVRPQPIDGTIARSISGVFEVWRATVVVLASGQSKVIKFG